MLNLRLRIILELFAIFLFVSLTLAFFRIFFKSGDLFTQINIATMICGLFILLYLKVRGKLNYENILVATLTALLFFTAHQTMLLNVDRSRSYFVIGWVHEGKITVKGNKFDFTKVNSIEKVSADAMVLRLNEQIERGYVRQVNQNLELTPLGKILFETADVLASMFSLENWNLNKT